MATMSATSVPRRPAVDSKIISPEAARRPFPLRSPMLSSLSFALASVQCSGKQNEGLALANAAIRQRLSQRSALVPPRATHGAPVLLSYFDEDGLTAALGQGAVLTLSAGLILLLPGLGQDFSLKPQSLFLATTSTWTALALFAALPIYLGAREPAR